MTTVAEWSLIIDGITQVFRPGMISEECAHKEATRFYNKIESLTTDNLVHHCRMSLASKSFIPSAPIDDDGFAFMFGVELAKIAIGVQTGRVYVPMSVPIPYVTRKVLKIKISRRISEF
jgi:hypothetical protein